MDLVEPKLGAGTFPYTLKSVMSTMYCLVYQNQAAKCSFMLGLAYGNGGRELRAISRPAWSTRVRPCLNGQLNTFYKCLLEHAKKCVVGVAAKQSGTPLFLTLLWF